jgi:hypothetical protein
VESELLDRSGGSTDSQGYSIVGPVKQVLLLDSIKIE